MYGNTPRSSCFLFLSTRNGVSCVLLAAMVHCDNDQQNSEHVTSTPRLYIVSSNRISSCCLRAWRSTSRAIIGLLSFLPCMRDRTCSTVFARGPTIPRHPQDVGARPPMNIYPLLSHHMAGFPTARKLDPSAGRRGGVVGPASPACVFTETRAIDPAVFRYRAIKVGRSVGLRLSINENAPCDASFLFLISSVLICHNSNV
ncbi:hypothetical protein BJ170DRAFT_423441 [Xylariales sp. AK1849]|nr:hypothetical protein BJ170DRAFT_423441 [Xylariales sp. AK1849]